MVWLLCEQELMLSPLLWYKNALQKDHWDSAISSERSGSSGYLGRDFSRFYSMEGGIQKLN